MTKLTFVAAALVAAAAYTSEASAARSGVDPGTLANQSSGPISDSGTASVCP